MYYPHVKSGISSTFNIQCPNQVKQLTLSLLHDATVRGDIHYYDVCKVVDSVTIAFMNYWKIGPGGFAVWPAWRAGITATMWEIPASPVKGYSSNIPYDWEIIRPFLDHYSLTPNWFQNQNPPKIGGVFDEETGTWTGIVGVVSSYNFKFVGKPSFKKIKKIMINSKIGWGGSAMQIP